MWTVVCQLNPLPSYLLSVSLFHFLCFSASPEIHHRKPKMIDLQSKASLNEPAGTFPF